MFHIYYPPLLFLTLFIVLAIMFMLRCLPRYLKIRHTTLPPKADWFDEEYNSTTSYA